MTQTATRQKTVREIPPTILTTTDKRNQYKQLHAAAYCRVSTDTEEQEHSFDAQVEYYTDKINRNPDWCMAGIFADEGISGTNANKRPEFMRMIKMCKQRKIDMILVKSISRFARNTVDCLNYVRLLKELNIPVIFEKESINTKLVASEMLLTVLGAFAQSESESLSENVKWGKRQSAKKGNVTMSYGSFLGYRKGANGQPEVVPEEAETIKLIFNSYLAGQSLQKIKLGLENRGILSPMDKPVWSAGTLKSILSNEKYKGDAVLQKTYIVDCISKKSKKNIGELPKYYIENSHPAIIEKSVFDTVQVEMARRSSKRKIKETNTITEHGKYSSKYALTELLICGNCGTPYRRVTWTKKSVKKVVWRCISRLDYGTKYCKNSPTLEEYKLQNAIVNAIGEVARSNATVFETLKLHIGMHYSGGNEDDCYAIELRINELRDIRTELISLNVQNGNDDQYDEKFKRIADEMASLKAKQEQLKAEQSTKENATTKLDEIFNILSGLKNHPIGYDDQIIRQLIECVKVMSADKLKIIFDGGIEMEANI